MAVVLLVGTLAIEASAALKPIYQEDDSGAVTEIIDYAATVKQYLNSEHEFKTDAEKLATMTLKYEKNGYQLWADEFTGEVATVNVATGQVLFTNPRDIASKNATHSSKADSIKYELMSQIIVKYLDNKATKTFNSFEQAAMNGQIDVKTIKNGLRVEYTIGREDTKYLVPRLIEKTRFEENILKPIATEVAPTYGVTPEEVMAEEKAVYFEFFKVKSYYLLKDPNAPDISDTDLQVMQNQFEITKKSYNGQLMAVYVCDPNITPAQLREVETRIKTYCPQYTYEQLDYDHELTEYVKDDRAPALFKMALEYRLDDFGLTVRLPANGIRFNEAEYQLKDITILPWMGAGSTDNTGYTFFPDGSGAIFRFEDNNENRDLRVEGTIYGQDFAYHTVTGTHQEVIRYPVFGIVQNRVLSDLELGLEVEDDETTGEDTDTPEGEEGTEPDTDTDAEPDAEPEDKVELTKEQKTLSTGFVAILEEGDALAKIELMHYNAYCKYNSVRVSVNPRPSDKYVLADAVSVGGNDEVTIISKRKYVGDYKIRYIMLTDDEVALENNIPDYYEASWLGMATAYRDYLTSPYSTGTQNLPEDQQVSVLNALTAEDVKEDIPLYIETFGSMQTIKKVLSIPVNAKVALTSFDNVQEMYRKLSEEAGIDNVNFKLTGYYNGGMYSSVPYKLKFEKSVGGKKGFEELLEDAKAKNYGVYLDFDFVYSTSSATKMFDGLSNNRDLVRAIDDRYTSKQYYSATRQSFTSYFELAISPSRFTHFYDKVSKEYLAYNPIGISLSTLASDLNSDFDEDDPYNRDDAKKFTVDLFKRMDADFGNVMVDSANAYTWRYIDHMINAAVDSSRYIKASNSVPFLGVVLHGYIQFAGTPMNMEGNIGYSMLKAIENGSGLYFILSYDNTELLKNDVQLSQYYSVRYDIWFDELVERYNAVNNVLKDLQLKLIINHEFLIGERIPDKDEIEADKIESDKQAEADRLAKEEADRIAFINQVREGRYSALTTTLNNLADTESLVKRFYDYADANDETIINPGYISQIKVLLEAIDAKDYFTLLTNAEEALKAAKEDVVVKEEAAKITDAKEKEAKKLYQEADAASKRDPNNVVKKEKAEKLKKEYQSAVKANSTASALLSSAKTTRDEAQQTYDDIKNDEDFVALGKVNKNIGDAIKTFNKYLDRLAIDDANMSVAFKEITKTNADGSYVYTVSIVADIIEKNEAMGVAKENLVNTIEAAIEAYREVYEKVLVYYPNQNYLDPEEEAPEEDDTDDGYNYTKYTNDDGNLIAVTYGDAEGNPYRTFILNYNFFDVTVEYNGKTYTVPAFGYVITEN